MMYVHVLASVFCACCLTVLCNNHLPCCWFKAIVQSKSFLPNFLQSINKHLFIFSKLFHDFFLCFSFSYEFVEQRSLNSLNLGSKKQYLKFEKLV